jgi:hypothetical protein
VVALSVLLAACGGGNNGGGGGGGELAMKIAIVNKTDADATVSLNTVDGPTGDPQTVESCDAAVVTFPLPFEDWTLMINDQVAVDSLELDPDLIDQNLIGTININEDGSLETKTLKVGRVQQQPAQLGICV